MPQQIDNSSLTTRLFLEGIEIDLSDDIDINNTYAVSDVREIGSKQSSFSKTITLPGTARNNKLFSFLFDVKSTGAEEKLFTSSGISVINDMADPTITNIVCPGFVFGGPIASGVSESGFHNEINSDDIYIELGDQSDAGYIICQVNNTIISCNRISSSVSRYYFPRGNYAFNDFIKIAIQDSAQAYSGNIGYDLNFKKKMRAHVIEDNQIVLSGYAKIVDANIKDGLSSFQLQITSDLGGFISTLANKRLEDLFTAVVTDLDADPTGQVSRTEPMPSPYDHTLEISNIIASWYDDPFNEKPYAYPLIDYGNSDTVGLTNFRTDTLRPALFAKTYWDLIFARAGFTYDSAFIKSQYFGTLIIPYKDGNISIVDTTSITATSSGSTFTEVVPNSGEDPVNSFYIFDTLINDPTGVYDVANEQYNCNRVGNYLASVSFTYFYSMNPGAGTSGLLLQNPKTHIFIHFELYNSGTTSPYAEVVKEYIQDIGAVTFSGLPYFIDAMLSDSFEVNIQDVPLNIQTPTDFIKVRIACSAIGSAGAFFPRITGGTVMPGTAELNIINGETIEPFLNISYSTNLDGQYLTFQDFVPKSVNQIDYINSIVKLFNLYPVQDKNKRNHFNIYTRDEFFANQKTLDWTDKIDLLSDINVKPIPELDASQLLFSYKEDKDWFNKQYNSLYGNFSYGSLRVETGYDFANKVNNVVEGLIFGPTPIVEFGQTITPGESLIEIINGDTTLTGTFPTDDVSSSLVLVAGYYSGNGANTPCEAQLRPTGNSVAGNPFTKAQIGVKVSYWGKIYLISEVINPYAFRVTDLLGQPTTLRRPITQGIVERISDVLYAANDGFYYITNSNIQVPCIYDSSDNNATHKPVKTEMKILTYNRLNGSTDKLYNPFYLQYTPVLQDGIFMFQAAGFFTTGGTDPGQQQLFSYPYCSHLNSPDEPTIDLLFDKPRSLFFNIQPSQYPKRNLYTRFWINTVNEIVDKDAKFVDCMMKLNSVDISNLDLSANIFINGTKFRINQIKDYSPDSSMTASEFIRLPKSVPTVGGIIVDAGPDNVVSGSTSTTLAGVVSWTDGGTGEFPESIVWVQISGPTTLTVSDPSSLTSAVSDIVEGDTYEMQLTVIDNYGQVGVDTMFITGAPPSPCTPFVNASNGGDIALPTDHNTLTGTADGCLFPITTIVSTSWTQIAGSSLIIISPSSLNTTVSGITATGLYTFRLTATDSNGNVAHDDTSFTVNPRPDPTLTFHFVHAGAFFQFSATLSYAIDAAVDIHESFSDGFTTTGCTGGAAGSAQFIAGTVKTITVGSVGVSWLPDSTSGVWTSVVKDSIYNINVNGTPVVNGGTLTIGSFTVHMVIPSCE